jgi:preprotein translocase subunit SecD
MPQHCDHVRRGGRPAICEGDIRNVNKVAIILDNKVISVANITSQFQAGVDRGKSANGSDCNDLAIALRSGKLVVNLKHQVAESTVSSDLDVTGAGVIASVASRRLP